MIQSRFFSIIAVAFIFLGIISILNVPFVATIPAFAQEGTEGSGGGASSGLPNPIGINDPRELAGRIIKAMLGVVGSIALLVFIYGGFMWVSSAGNEDKVQKGKNAILWASLGIAIIFLSYAMVTFVITAITGSTSSGGADAVDTGPDETGQIIIKYKKNV